MKKIYAVLIFATIPALSLFSQTMEVELTPMMDNTVFKDTDVSNGLGEYIFSGKTNQGIIKRALVKFDLTKAVPDGITIDSVLLTLVPDKIKPGSTQM